MSASATHEDAGVKDASVRMLLIVYKRIVSPLLHAAVGAVGACRFQPTCSEYAAIAIAQHGITRGSIMTLGRLLRCHPLHTGGFDPVPARRGASPTSIRVTQIP